MIVYVAIEKIDTDSYLKFMGIEEFAMIRERTICISSTANKALEELRRFMQELHKEYGNGDCFFDIPNFITDFAKSDNNILYSHKMRWNDELYHTFGVYKLEVDTNNYELCTNEDLNQKIYTYK